MGVVAAERVWNILKTTGPYHKMHKAVSICSEPLMMLHVVFCILLVNYYLLFSLRGACNLNRVHYSAAYMGHKVQTDQNEKLVMFGVTHVLGIDGYSSKVVAQAAMPVKNNLPVYEDGYRLLQCFSTPPSSDF